MVYLYWLGAFIVFSPLILGLPFLSRNRVYRAATLFAGMNAGIITLCFFINLLRWGAGPTSADQFHVHFTSSLPNIYITSLVIGSTIVSRYYLDASSQIGAVLATLGTLLAFYLFSALTTRLLEVFSITITEGFPSIETLWDIAHYFIITLTKPNLSFLALVFVSAFIALNGTAAAMRISDEAETSKDEKME